MIELLQKVWKDCNTGPDGVTYDPARVFGYNLAALGTIGFIGDSLIVAISKGSFDPQSYGIGLGAILAGIAAIGGGVAWKAKTEPRKE